MDFISPKYRWIFASSLIILVIWGAASQLVAREIILPTPLDTLVYVGELLLQGDTWRALGATLGRVLFSFTINIVLALAIGVTAGFLRQVEYALTPVIAIMKAVPTMGVILLSLIWFNSETAVLFVCTLIVFPVLFNAVLKGIHHLDAGLMKMHQVYRISWTKTVGHFLLPSLRPYLIAGITSGLGLSMKVIVAAEVLAQPGTGIGTMFQIERARLNTVGVFAWSLLVIILTAGLDFIFAVLRRRHGKGT